MSHHLGRWRLQEDTGVNPGMSSLVALEETGQGQHALNIIHGGKAWESVDPDSSRVWWEDVGVHQNLTHAVHPDPISGAHCWLQKAINVRKAAVGENHGDVWVDTNKSMQVYHEWKALTRSATHHSPDGTRRPNWYKRPLSPQKDAWKIPEKPWDTHGVNGVNGTNGTNGVHQGMAVAAGDD